MAKLDYDPEVIVRYAQRLYARATWITFVYTAVPFVVSVASSVIFKQGLVVAPVAAMIGWRIGRWRSDWLRVRAQRLMCEVFVEANTRETARLVGELVLRAARSEAHARQT